MDIKTIFIVMSDVCNAECKICYESCSPHGKNIIDEKLMREILNQANKCGLSGTIAFGGGEPLLHYELLKMGLEYAKESGFKTEISTNGFWGKWTDEQISEKIGVLPIDIITISTDSYHEQYIPDSDIHRAVTFAKKANLKLFLRIGETKSGESIALYFNRMDAYKYLCNTQFYPFVRTGRADTLPADDFYRLLSTNDMRLRCTSNHTIAVRYDGEVFPCAEFITNDTEFSLGNINRITLSDIIEENTPLLSLLSEKDGLFRLMHSAKSEWNINIPEFCGSGCEICYSILKDKNLCEQIIIRQKGGLL